MVWTEVCAEISLHDCVHNSNYFFNNYIIEK